MFAYLCFLPFEYHIMLEDEYITQHHEITMVEDEQISQKKIPEIDVSKEPFSEYFALGNFNHKVLFSPNHIPEDLKHGYDHINDFLLKKESFQRRMNWIRHLVKIRNKDSDFKKLEKQIRHLPGERCVKVSSHIPKLLKFVGDDPDPYFVGEYNWYYTGGTMQTVNNNDSFSLLFVEKSDKDYLCVAPLGSKRSWHLDSTQIRRVSPYQGEEIFQIVGVDNSDIIGARQKSACSVYSIPASNEDNHIQELCKINSPCPLVGFDISSVHKELCVMDAGCILSFWDLNEKKLPVSLSFVSNNASYDRWHSLWYSHTSPSEIVVASRKLVKWCDRRSKTDGSTLDLQYISGREMDEEISIHFESKCYSNGVYIGTNVSLLLMDIRMLDSPVHSWSHRLTHPPLYSSVISQSDSKEIACIANHYPGDVVLAFSTPEISYPLVELPSRIDSLLKYQSQGRYLDPSLQPRLAPGLSGLAAISNKGSLDATILTQSRTSEIFSQSVFRRKTKKSKIVPDFSILATKKEKLIASNRWDMSKLYEHISSRNNETANSSADARSVPKRNQKWQLSIAELKDYKDALSSLIMDEWDCFTEAQELTSHIDKVNAWLDSNKNGKYFSEDLYDI